MVYYTVGIPIKDLTQTFFSGIKARSISKEELLATLFQQKTLRLFSDLESARGYAKSLRRFAAPPKTSLDHNKVAPIFTVEIKEKTELGTMYQQIITYNNGVDEHHNVTTKDQKINYNEINTQQIAKILQAEFVDSPLPTIDFNQDASVNYSYV